MGKETVFLDILTRRGILKMLCGRISQNGWKQNYLNVALLVDEEVLRLQVSIDEI